MNSPFEYVDWLLLKPESLVELEFTVETLPCGDPDLLKPESPVE